MSTLTGQLQSGSYKDLLQVSNSNSGIDSTLRTVSDGEGTNSILKLSTTDARFANINFTGSTISSTVGTGLNITPFAGQKLILDGHWQFDGADLTAITDNNTTFTAYTGKNITIESVTFDNNVVTATTFTGALTGNASTATILETARTIGGVSFNGSANITVASATGGFAVSGGELDLTGVGAWIDLNPASTSSRNIIDIVPTGALGSSAVWKGLNIDGAALDPSATAAEIYGLYCDFSGVNLTNDPILEGIRIVMPSTYSGEVDHCAFDATGNSGRRVEIIGNFSDALHIDGEIHSNYTIPSTTLAHFTVHDFVVDASAQVSTSETHITDYALADGLANGSVVAIGIHPNIDVIHQHSGTFTAFGANFAGRYVGSTYTDNIDDIVTFVSVDDEIWIGHTAKFDEVEFSMTTPATKDIKPEFYYYKTTTGWTEFFPADDTNGFTQSGTIRFASGDLTTWDSTGAGEADSGYWIKIKRKRVSTPGTVQIDTSKYLVAVTYSWDASGNISVNGITATSLSVTGNVSIGIASSTSKLHVYSDDNPNGVFMVDIDNHDGNGTDARGLKVRGGALNSVIPIFVIADYDDVPKFSVMGDGKVGIRTESPSSPFHIKASTPGVVGDNYAGQLIIQSPTNDVNTRVVIAGYKSNDSGNPDEQLWYIGSASGGNENVTFLNQRNAPLSLGTSGTVRFSISGAGAVDVVNDFTAGTITSDAGVSGTTITGTLQTAAQTNITSVGTLTGLAVGNVVSNSNYVMEGYSTGRNVIRSLHITIVPGANPNTNITCSSSTTIGRVFNFPTVTTGTNLAKSGTEGSFSLSADGTTLTIDLTETVIGILGHSITTHDINSSSATELYTTFCYVDSGNLVFIVNKRPDQTASDLTDIIDTDDKLAFEVSFVTNS